MTKQELLSIIEQCIKDKRNALNLSHGELTELPNEIGNIGQLLELNLSGNQLTALPESIGQLSQLQRLNLNENQLTALPESIGQLSQLKTLYLSENQLTALPESIGQLSQLQRLYLSENQLTALPESIGQLSQLQRLYLNENQLTALPKSIGQLSQLQWLNLSENQLTALPESIGQLSQLQRLNLSENRLTALPEGIDQLTNLTNLRLEDNRELGIPSQFLRENRDDPKGIIAVIRLRTQLDKGNIIRSIEFPPEYHQAGVGILSYFATILRQQYPDQPVKVRIEQEGLKVTMVIETPEGEKKRIEDLLSNYGRVIQGELLPEEFTSNLAEVIDLRNQLRLAKVEIENKKDLLRLSEANAERLYSLLHEALRHKQLPPSRGRRKAKSLLEAFDEALSEDEKKQRGSPR